MSCLFCRITRPLTERSNYPLLRNVEFLLRMHRSPWHPIDLIPRRDPRGRRMMEVSVVMLVGHSYSLTDVLSALPGY